MSKQKSLLLAGGAIMIFLIVGRVVAIQVFTTTPDELGASIIDPNKAQINTDTIIPSSNSVIPSDPVDTERQNELPTEFRGTTRILVPPHISATTLSQLTTLINTADNTNITAIFDQSESYEAYIESLEKGDYDIALTTPNHISNLDLDHISLPLDPSMRSGIHPSAQQAARRQNIFFVPFALDPYIAAVHDSIPGEIDSRNSLSRRISLYPNSDMTPHAYGSSEMDNALLESGQHVISMYADNQAYIDIALQNTQKSELSRLVENNTAYSAETLLRSALDNRRLDPSCLNNVMSCLDKNEQFQSVVGVYHTLVDIDSAYRYTILDDADPLIWGWIVNPNSPDRLSILGRILGYLQQAPGSNIPLRNNTLPVFIDNLDIALSRKQLSGMREGLE